MFKRFKILRFVGVLMTATMIFTSYVMAEDLTDAGTYLGEGDDIKGFLDGYVKSNPSTAAKSKGAQEKAYQYKYEVDGETYYFKKSEMDNIKKKYDAAHVDSENDDTGAAIEEVRRMADGISLQPDMTTAYTALSGFSGLLSVFIGVCIALVTLLTVAVTVCDICYITLPYFRENVASAGEGGNGGLYKAAQKFVSNEAKYAVKKCSIDSGKNPLTMYLGKRAVAYIFLSIALFILLTGNISIIINIALRAVGGVVDALKAIGA